MPNQNENLEQLIMKRCSYPKCELVFLQVARVLRKFLRNCFRSEMKDAFVYPKELKTDSNNTSLLFGC